MAGPRDGGIASMTWWLNWFSWLCESIAMLQQLSFWNGVFVFWHLRKQRESSELPLGFKLHRNTNLVTAVEVMPSTNEQACIRMVRNFGLGESSGWWFLQAQVETQSVRFGQSWADLSCRFFRCSSIIPLHFTVGFQGCKGQSWCQSSGDVWDGRLCAAWCAPIVNVYEGMITDHKEDVKGIFFEIFSKPQSVQLQKPWPNFRSTESRNCQLAAETVL